MPIRVPIATLLLVLLVPCAQADDAGDLMAEVEALRAPRTPWRAIPWKSCLLDGLAAARKAGKPLMLWVFIDRPVDDARC